MSYLRGKRYNGEKQDAYARPGNENAVKREDQNDLSATADRLATEYKVSAPTIKRDGQYAAAVDTLASATPGFSVKPMHYYPPHAQGGNGVGHPTGLSSGLPAPRAGRKLQKILQYRWIFHW